MSRAVRLVLLAAALMLTAGAVHAVAPSGKEIMRPIDTSAGSISDPRKLLTVDLDRTLRVSVSSMPIEVAFNQINAILGLEFGYGEGVTSEMPVTLTVSGKGRDVLKALGGAAGIRFEVNGPTQLKVVRAREKAPLRKTPPSPKHH